MAAQFSQSSLAERVRAVWCLNACYGGPLLLTSIPPTDGYVHLLAPDSSLALWSVGQEARRAGGRERMKGQISYAGAILPLCLLVVLSNISIASST